MLPHLDRRFKADFPVKLAPPCSCIIAVNGY